jgi:RNA polymerase sigma factor for flagellar operon FliA
MPSEQEIERLVRENMGLIRTIVGKVMKLYTRLPGGFDREDLTSFAFYGLLRAARTYDASRGAAFSTYAYKCIVNAIRGELERARSHQTGSDGQTIEQISLQHMIGPDGDTELQEQIEDVNSPDAEEMVISRFHRAELQEAVRGLPEQEAKVVWGVYFNQQPLNEVARSLRLSPQRVQMIHARALKKLRRRLHATR